MREADGIIGIVLIVLDVTYFTIGVKDEVRVIWHIAIS
jgi:hypothetical protein